MAPEAGIEVGVATRVVTPPMPVALAGYGDRLQPATGVHDDLEVRVVVFRRGALTLCLVALDLMVMSPDWAGDTRRAVAQALGIDVAQVITTTVHTHAAPSTVTGTDLLGWEVPDRWRPDLLAALRAIGADGDEALTLLSVGVHGVVLGPANREVSSDWIGVCRSEVQRALGGICVVVQGCHGDVDPRGMCWEGSPQDWFGAVESVGKCFASAALDAAASAAPVDGPTRVVRHTTIGIDASGSGLAMLTGRDAVDVELAEWEVDGVRIVTVPGEGFAELGARIVTARTTSPTLIVGLAPHWLGYLPVPFGDGYEEGLSYGAAFVERVTSELSEPA